MEEEIDEDRPKDLALCIVCDIRGFTSLQTRVHDLVFESVSHDPTDGKLIAKAYSDYVRQTQKLAHRALTDHLTRSKIERDYVVKATGDGYMIALRLTTLGLRQSQETGFAWKLIRAAFDLAFSSDIGAERPGRFAAATEAFLDKHGKKLGFDLEYLRKEPGKIGRVLEDLPRNTRFRIAVGASLGFASFEDPPERSDRGDLPLKYAPRLRDVSGYGVNLAFRLCEHAGRGYDPSDHRCTPPVLLDRRIGRLLMAKAAKDSFTISPWHQPLGLKGIDEGWAYYLHKNG